MIKAGDKIKRHICYGYDYKFTGEKPQEGTVIYVHPKRRFCVVEFPAKSAWEPRSIRESYHLDGRLPKAKKETVGNHYGNARGIYFADLQEKREEDDRRRHRENYFDHKP